MSNFEDVRIFMKTYGQEVKTKSELSNEKRTMIFYESPHKLIKTLNDFSKAFGSEREVSVTKEISKVFESTFRGKIVEVIEQINETKIKGEFVIVVAGIK